ncbi:hypothetical protein SAMN04488564_1236 [Lentzea waywayandensis]|uniref:Uncharacterized protein n=1 Tax=Lentzea waywayandensis TaxID=84724 RepID=A0A1I6FIW7_9PSEU|nr:hypothetical protein [Lentzea waywayandensis]SFR29891.1 hypothetical protein SAMN04488564_1236 [Lentzea waywayandensis]
MSNTFEIIRREPTQTVAEPLTQVPLLQDTALYVASLPARFTTLFGTKHLDATERHEGTVMAVVFEAVISVSSSR